MLKAQLPDCMIVFIMVVGKLTILINQFGAVYIGLYKVIQAAIREGKVEGDSF
jgi:uncharacterized ion transporter superfamily protein YfcC